MSEPYVVKMPQLSDTMTEGVMVSWEKNVGDEVKRGDIVATVGIDCVVIVAIFISIDKTISTSNYVAI